MSFEDLLLAETKWKTSMGLSFPGERVVFRGKDLFSELSEKSWMELLLYGVTGREFTKEQLKLFEAIWVISTSYPDPRIWNNRVSGFAGSCRSSGSLGLAAGIAVSEAQIYGMKPIIRSFEFLTDSNIKVKNGYVLSHLIKIYIKKYRALPGYARPVISIDERIEPLMKVAKELGLASGEHIKLAFEISDELRTLGYRMNANIASIAAGLVADQGLSTIEYYYYLINCFTIGFVTCHLDAITKKEGTLFPLTCKRVNYEGKEERNW